jgi:type I restriction enzyme R subunit
MAEPEAEYVVIDRGTIDTIKRRDEGKATKVINLIKAIEKEAEEKSEDPFLLAMADRAKAVQEAFESRQDSTEKALEDLLAAITLNEERKKEQAAKGLDSLTYFMMSKFTEEGIPNPEKVAGKVREAFEKHSNWKTSEAELREARKQVTFAIFSEEDDLNKVTATVEALFTLLQRSYKP